MITLIDRQTVFGKYKYIAEEIAGMQSLFFDDDLEYFENEQDRVEYLKLFDAKDLFIKKPQKFYSVISFDHSKIATFSNVLSQKLLALLSDLRVNSLVMIAHYKMNFVGNIENTYRPLQAAFKKFEEITKNINYSEVFEFGIEDLPKLLEIVFWIERCDASGPEYIFFHDQDEKIAFYLCKDGNVHIIEFNIEILSDSMLSKNGWEFVQGQCYNKFSATSKIEGRKSKL